MESLVTTSQNVTGLDLVTFYLNLRTPSPGSAVVRTGRSTSTWPTQPALRFSISKGSFRQRTLWAFWSPYRWHSSWWWYIKESESSTYSQSQRFYSVLNRRLKIVFFSGTVFALPVVGQTAFAVSAHVGQLWTSCLVFLCHSSTCRVNNQRRKVDLLAVN